MRQVPSANLTYLVIGSGKMATHFCHYLTHLNIPFYQWSRRHSTHELTSLLAICTHVFVLIKDSAIQSFNELSLQYPDKKWVHFSGQYHSLCIHSAHPLMTFGQTLYDIKAYYNIPFITTTNSPSFAELLPNIPNPSYAISPHLKSLYHALCVIAGNFTCLVWQEFMHNLNEIYNIPMDVAIPYLNQVTRNIINNPQNCLTGPLVRNDKETVKSHLHALNEHSLHNIYQSILQFYQIKNDTNLLVDE